MAHPSTVQQVYDLAAWLDLSRRELREIVGPSDLMQLPEREVQVLVAKLEIRKRAELRRRKEEQMRRSRTAAVLGDLVV